MRFGFHRGRDAGTPDPTAAPGGASEAVATPAGEGTSQTSAATPRTGGTSAAAGATIPRDKRIRVSDLLAPRTVFVAVVAILTLFGLVMVFSASSIELLDEKRSAFQELFAQLRFIALGLLFAAILVRVPYTFWLDWFIYVLWAATFVMLAATLAIGTEGLGATRWLYIGSVGIQPSEFAKILVIMVAARIATEYFSGAITGRRFLLFAVLGGVVPIVLIGLEKDLGTIIILAMALICMMLLTELPRWWAVVAFFALVIIAVVMIATAGYRSSRFASWLTDPFDSSNSENYYGQGWQVRHSLFAFASGGFFGVGLGNSRQKYSYLPEAENDFVFAVIGEELGLLGTLFVIALFCLLGWAGLRIARQAPDGAGKLLAGGLTCCILIQALVNMCGVLRILPLTGRPLPFISAGGSSMLATYLMVGLILSVANVTARQAREASPRRASREHLRLVDDVPRRDGNERPTRPAGGATRRRGSQVGERGRDLRPVSGGRTARRDRDRADRADDEGAPRRERPAATHPGRESAPETDGDGARPSGRGTKARGGASAPAAGRTRGRSAATRRNEPHETGEADDEHRGDSGRRDGRSHQSGAGTGRGAARPRP